MAPRFTYLGLAGMITVASGNHARFKWNVKELRKEWTLEADTNPSMSWTNYYPDYFTVNGWSAPLINDDTTARVEGGVGDTILIYLGNTGRSVHSMHFHGYHAEILYSSKFPNHVGRSKDTFPMLPMETMVLRLVPDKTGEFPVHDHNLVAVSAGNYYPNGMFMTLLIQ